MPTTIATWNVNSINARLPNVLEWLEAARPDILLLQEIKCPDAAFPIRAFAELGYEAAVHGQRSYNGVAIVSRRPLSEIVRGLPGDPADEQARYIQAKVGDLVVASIYLPNGNPVGTDKFAYKLAWIERLRAHAATLLEERQAIALGGDYNVIPEPIDCHDPKAWEGDALFRPESRRAWRSLLHLGYADAFRALHPDQARAYSFWDYQGGAFQLDHGIRIDHILLSPLAVDCLTACTIDKEPRRRPKASDHTPVLATLDDAA